jgi:hypothetical protein
MADSGSSWRGLALVGVPLVFVIAIAGWATTFGPLARGRAELAPGLHAIGVDDPVDVVLGEVRTIRCRLANALDRTIEIESLSTGCPCRTASVTPRSLAPGARAEVEIVYDSSHSGDRDLAFPIVVTCPDGERITAEGQIAIHHERAIAIDGAPVDFGEVPLHASAVRTMTVTAPAGAFRAVRATSAIDGLDVAVKGGDGSAGTIECRLAAPASVRDLSGTVRVEVEGFRGRDVVFEVPLRGAVVGPVAIHPPSGFVGMLAPGKTKTVRFDVKARGDAKPITIDTVSGPPWARVSHVCFASPAAAVLDVTFDPEGAPADLRQFDLDLSGTVDGQPFLAVIPCVAVAISAGP